MKKFLVEFSVADEWIEDGFKLDDEKALAMLWDQLPFALAEELGARVIEGDPIEVLQLFHDSLPDLPYLIGALGRAGIPLDDVKKVMEAVGRMEEVLGKLRGEK